MAYAESTMGGSLGGSFRVFVNSIRTRQGDASNNTEDWYCNGGVNRVSTSGGRIYNGYNSSTYTIQLGINGMATSGNWSYDSTGTGNILSRNTGTTTASRNSAGVGFGFTSRTDANMDNSPYVTSGWVQSSDSVATIYRHASLTALSMDAGGVPATDEGPLWLEFTNPAGASVDAWIESPPGTRIYTSAGGQGSRFNYPNLSGGSLSTALQSATPNSNTATLRIGIHDVLGGDNWDYRDRTYTIANDHGQANPTFTTFTYADTNSTTTTVTGNNQYLVQGKSTLAVTITTGNKATPNKQATMSTYTTSIGSNSRSDAYSSSSTVTATVGTVSDVTGAQNLSVTAVDSRGNTTTATQSVTVLPYHDPGFYGGLDVFYTNNYDSSGGISLSLYTGNVIGSASPLTISGTDKNVVNTTSGIQFDMSKNDNTSFTGTWVNVATTNATDHSGLISVNPTTLGSAILTKMTGMGADNTTPWFVKFKITDAFSTQYYTAIIDIGRPIFRIGHDGHLYHNEIEISQAVNNRQSWLEDVRLGVTGTGTWAWGTLTGFLWGYGWCLVNSTSPAIGDYQYHNIFLPTGTYSIMTSFVASTDSAITKMTLIGGPWGAGVDQYSKDNYNSTTTENTFTLTNMIVQDAGVFTFKYTVTGKNASSSSYLQRLVGIRVTKTA